ncbi:uncharacterized protein CXQ87_000371 [Candidozyma duobushaemuli]|uniref:Major facilitator superfamily (MFS) profile domain-containing protein n=2 Tax=Candidozyma TaxID=3303203 RepID=A0ABX8HZX9_9ASCO|nr:uncharacterized protein CXQ87_000371 [[Candida] duobushaemulonis]PVH17485.1 hypothetical protein CXQ87_000371 [[Candida] duobushaemulonis]QWU86122.1 hypothetical protein CA3LBN_000340 [[Candida] haemuloni]
MKEESEIAYEEQPAVPSPEEISLLHELSFVFLVCLCQILTQAGVAQTINPVKEIGSTFDVQDSPGKLSWFSASYSLTVGTFILIAGRLGDLHGYKLIFNLGFMFFGIWSLIAGFSGFTDSDVFFNVARAFQGLGPAFSMPNAVALLGHYFPMSKKKMIYMAMFGAVAPFGFVLGAIFSGIFAQLVWWPWAFWVNGIVCLCVVVASYFIIPKNIGSKSQGSFDWWGSFTGVSGLVLINFAWNQGPNVGWDVPYVYVLLIVGFLFMGAFCVASKYAANPLLPTSCLKGETGFVLGCIASGWSCFGIWLYYSFRWAETVDNLHPILSAVQFIPAPFCGLCAAGLTVFLLRKSSSSVVMVVALLAFFVGIVLMGTRAEHQIYWGQKFFSILIQSFGMDMSFPAGTMILSSVLPRHQQGLAGSLVSTFVNYSISIGLGIAGTVEYYTTKDLTPGYETTVKGYRHAFYIGMGLAGLGVILSVTFLVLQSFGNQKRDSNFDDGLKSGSSTELKDEV